MRSFPLYLLLLSPHNSRWERALSAIRQNNSNVDRVNCASNEFQLQPDWAVNKALEATTIVAHFPFAVAVERIAALFRLERCTGQVEGMDRAIRQVKGGGDAGS